MSVPTRPKPSRIVIKNASDLGSLFLSIYASASDRRRMMECPEIQEFGVLFNSDKEQVMNIKVDPRFGDVEDVKSYIKFWLLDQPQDPYLPGENSTETPPNSVYGIVYKRGPGHTQTLQLAMPIDLRQTLLKMDIFSDGSLEAVLETLSSHGSYRTSADDGQTYLHIAQFVYSKSEKKWKVFHA